MEVWRTIGHKSSGYSWRETTQFDRIPRKCFVSALIAVGVGACLVACGGGGGTVTPLPPSITSLTPASGITGQSVTIAGAHFGAAQGTSTVTFNGAAAAATSWGDTSITAKVPASATTGNVVVAVGGQLSNGVPFTVIPPPAISSVAPISGAAGQSVTISGSNFGATQGTSTVTFNGIAATPTSWSAASIVVPVPANATTGNVVVTVNTQGSNGVLFTVIPPPSISSVAPASGVTGQVVTITGTNFGATQGTSAVAFNGVIAVPTSWSATSIVAPVPVTAATGNVVVTVSGAASNGVPFTVIPRATSLSPVSGDAGALITVGGSGFGAVQGTSTVTFNGAVATPTNWSTTSITVPVPAAATTGDVVVTVGGSASNGVRFTLTIAGMAAVLTQHNDSARTGANTLETILTPAKVTPATFGSLFTQTVDGLIVAQPLYLPQVMVSGARHNVVYVVTQHDSVYAFDADSAAGANANPLWHVNFTDSASGVTTVPILEEGCDTTVKFTEVGIMGTPVIDAQHGVIYFVVKTKEVTAGVATYVFRLHALDVTTGAEMFGGPSQPINPSVVSSTQGIVTFDPLMHMQRPGLLLSNGTLYIGFGSNGCDVPPAHGWVLGFDPTSLQPTAVFNTTPVDTESRGSVWQSGGGIASDSSGNLFFSTANGPFSADVGGQDYSSSFLKLHPVAQSGQISLNVADYFTPYDQLALSLADLDIGSVGVTVLPDQPGPHPHLLLGSGKEGSIYLIDRDNMGHYNANDVGNVLNPVQFLFQVYGSANEAFNTPAYWNSTVFLSGGHTGIVAYPLVNGLLGTRLVGAACCANAPSISANGNSNGIVWVSGDTDLWAFDAVTMTQLIDLQLTTISNLAAHFATVTVVNGKVYAGTGNQLIVLGLK